MVNQARKMAYLGAKGEEIADFFDVTTTTLFNWRKAYPEFDAAITSGKDALDARVVKSLFHRAMGYDHPEVHVSNYQGEITLTPLTKRYPPDTGAIALWLKNRRPNEWRDRVEHTGPDGGPIALELLSADKLKAKVRGS